MVNLRSSDDKKDYFVSNDLYLDEEFMKEWQNKTDKLKIIYNKLEKMFDDERNSIFCLYNKTLLSDDFLKAFKYGMNSRWDDSLVASFDPACNAFTANCGLKQQDLKNIQNILAKVYENHGEKGLKILRSINFAQGVMDYNLKIIIDDADDKYDLPIVPDSNRKILEVKRDTMDLEKVTMDIIENSTFLTINNENIKSALFFVYDLLYEDNGEMVDNSKILSLKFKIALDDTSIGRTLNKEDFFKAVRLSEKLYVDLFEDKIPRKRKNKEYIKTANN